MTKKKGKVARKTVENKEEFYSTAKELETSKEELQSDNEDLTTVNNELKVKVDEVSHANSDLENLIRSTNIATIFLDKGMNIKRYTPSVTSIFNLIPEDIGRPLSHIAHRLSPNDFQYDAARVLESLQPIEREVYSDDNRIFIARFSPYRTVDDKIDGTVISFIDITDRKRIEKKLRESEVNYRGIVNQTIAGISKVDAQGYFIFSNDQMANMLGYSVEEMLQLTIEDVVYGKDMEKNNELFKQMISTGDPYTIEKRMLCKDGHFIWCNNQVSPIMDKENRFISAVIVSIDITEQKNIEEQKDDFIGIASHELKTPLTGIKAYSELLLEKLSDEEQSSTFPLIQKLNNQVDRLHRLIYGLLDTTRISDGRFDLKYGSFDLNELIEKRVSEVRLTSPDYKFIIETGSIQTVSGDEERIGQVLTNLISNAVKYSPDADKVIISSEDIEGKKVKVCVRDFGPGLKPQLREKIFKRFYRSLNNGNASGFGLGLYISKEIIKLHFGEIGIENPETGSIFYFIIPYKP